MDESGLFFRMDPRKSYLSKEDDRSAIRGTEFNKHKDRVTMVLACIAVDHTSCPTVNCYCC